MERHEISLLEEELVQLTAKSSKVILGDSPTLLCSVAGQSLFLISFDSEDDLELVLEGRHWLFRRQLIIFDRLLGPTDQKQIRLDLMHVIGSTFGGVIRSEVKGDFFRLRVQLDVRKPLRRGIFISADKKKK
ncbi:hypothetical protein Godav_009763, partial [Gossypium davidsonii]|nr:hypothetical protein [Gossypium davidsonii]MBA0659987.1 hypothetical protein [Gossypium klotzschianum]